jgi:hypothetical protein
MKKIICLAFLAGLFLCVNSCHDEEIRQREDLVLKSGSIKKKDTVAGVKSWFENNPEQNKFELLKWVNDIKWSNAQMMEIDSSLVVEVPIKLKDKYLVTASKDSKLNIEYRLLFKNEKGKVTSFMEYFFSKKELGFLHDARKTNFSKKNENFEGTIVLENSKKEFDMIYRSETMDDCNETKLKSAQVICYLIWEIFSDGSCTLIYMDCIDNGGSIGDVGYGGSSDTTPLPTTQSCNCDICPVCHKCLNMLKNAPVDNNGGTTTTTAACPMCTCPLIVIDPNLPCAGDPIKSPSIAPSGASGQTGGLFGCVRIGTSPQCNNLKKYHDGVDIECSVNQNVYSMYSGVVVDKNDSFRPGEYAINSYGNYITIRCTRTDGVSFDVKYNHLNTVGLNNGDSVTTGQIVGKSGDTGNAAADGIRPHVHIQIFVNNTSIDPCGYFATFFNTDGTVSNPCN